MRNVQLFLGLCLVLLSPLQTKAFGYIPLTLGQLIDGSDAIVVAKVAKVVYDEPDSIANYQVGSITFVNFSFADATYTIQVIEKLAGIAVPSTLQFLQKPGFSSCPPTPSFDNDTNKLLLMFLEQTDNGFVIYPNADGLKTVTNRELEAYKTLIAQRLELMQGESKTNKKQLDFRWQLSCLKHSVAKWDAYRSIAKHLGILNFWGFEIENRIQKALHPSIKIYFNQFGLTDELKLAARDLGPERMIEVTDLIHHFDPNWKPSKLY